MGQDDLIPGMRMVILFGLVDEWIAQLLQNHLISTQILTGIIFQMLPILPYQAKMSLSNPIFPLIILQRGKIYYEILKYIERYFMNEKITIFLNASQKRILIIQIIGVLIKKRQRVI